MLLCVARASDWSRLTVVREQIFLGRPPQRLDIYYLGNSNKTAQKEIPSERCGDACQNSEKREHIMKQNTHVVSKKMSTTISPATYQYVLTSVQIQKNRQDLSNRNEFFIFLIFSWWKNHQACLSVGRIFFWMASLRTYDYVP
jgi:hypothetical protein